MPNLPKICPNCGRRYPWYVAECEVCHVSLIIDESPAEDDDSRTKNEQSFVFAFETDDPVALAMAKEALDKADIPFMHSFVELKGTNRRTWQPDAEVPAKLVVNADDAEKAAEALADLAPEAGDVPAVDAPEETRSNIRLRQALPSVAASARQADNMAPSNIVQLHNADTNQPIGEIRSDELQFLFDQLERESDSDDDFFIDAATIEMLEDAKAPAHLVEMLKKAVGNGEGVEVRWARAEDR